MILPARTCSSSVSASGGAFAAARTSATTACAALKSAVGCDDGGDVEGDAIVRVAAPCCEPSGTKRWWSLLPPTSLADVACRRTWPALRRVPYLRLQTGPRQKHDGVKDFLLRVAHRP